MANIKTDSGRLKLLIKNYLNAKKDGKNEGYDIKTVTEDNYEHYYILFKPVTGIYRDQYHVLEMKTKYGTDNDKYPYNAPYITFRTSVYHTNISTGGAICLDILKDKSKWMPTYDYSSIIRNILLLFEEPNNASPFNGNASSDYVKCEKEYKAAISKKKLSLKELDDIKDDIFKSFKKKADDYTNSNKKILKDFGEWFPVLRGDQMDDSDEIKELEEMLQKLKVGNKNTDKTNTLSSNSSISNSNNVLISSLDSMVNTADVSASTSTSVSANTNNTAVTSNSVTNTTNSEKKDDVSDDAKKKFNVSRWQKYRTAK